MTKLSQLIWRRNKEPSEVPNLGETVQKVVQSKDFNDKLEAASPVLIGAALTWPLYWLFRGFSWTKHSEKQKLPVYIKKTYYQAKFLTIVILATGIIAAIAQDREHTIREVK